MDWSNKEDVVRALLFLHSMQTTEEQVIRQTTELNGVGFNHIDATFCTSVAQWVLSGKPMTHGQFDGVNIIIRKYSGQLDGVDLSDINLPPTAMTVLNSNGHKPEQKGDGLLSVRDNKLIFVPWIYPSRQAKDIGFNGRKEEGEFWWEAPLNLSIAEDLIRSFPRVVKDDSYIRWEEGLDKIQAVPDFVENSSAFSFQKEAVSFNITAEKALDAMAPGLGKSLAAAMTCKAVKAKRILIICPLTLCQNWRREVKKWIGVDAVIWHQDPSTWRKASQGWVITNYDTVVRQLDMLKRMGFEAVIIDESLIVKNHARAQDDNNKWYFKTKRVNAVFELTRNVKWIFELSGYPKSKFIDDLWTQLHILDPKRFSSYWKFAYKYCIVETNSWGKRVIADKEGAYEMLKNDCRDIFFARTQDQVLNLPPWIFDTYEIEMDKEQTRIYNEMERDFLSILPDGDEVLSTNILSQMVRLIQFASNHELLMEKFENPSNKWKAVSELLEFEEKPAIVWTNFIRTAEYMEKVLKDAGYRVAVLTGNTPESARQPIVDKFQGGELDVIVAHPGVGKYGLTLTAGRTCIYLERSYNSDDYYQSLHRVRRIGTTQSPHIIHLLSTTFEGTPTIDHVIHRVLKYRRESGIALTTGLIRKALNDHSAL